MLEASEFVLTGTIVEPGGSNVKSLPPSQETAVMRVNSIAEGAPDQRIISPLDDVTLIFPQPEPWRSGTRVIVFARTSIVGERIALSVLQSSDPGAGDDISAITARIPELKRSREADALRQRLAGAEAIVLGRFSRRLDAADEMDVLSEHHPQLKAAVIEVDEQLSGTPVPSPLIVRYATARDKFWKGAPNLELGVTPHIYVLRLVEPYSERRFDIGGSVTRVYTLLDPADLLPATDLERIREIISAQLPSR